MASALHQSGSSPSEQLPEESGKAYQAFRSFLELGPDRTIAGLVRLLAKSESLIRGWAARHDWRHRAWLYDRDQSRQDETAVRQHRATVLSERLDDLDRMGLACLAFFRTMVRRDPGTGEIAFDRRFTPQVALRFLELALKAQGAFDRHSSEDKANERPAADLFGMADAELIELIDLARQRADQQDPRQETNNESDQGTTRQEQHEEERDRQDEAGDD